MAGSDDDEMLFKVIPDNFRLLTETHYRGVIDGQYKRAEDALCAGIDALRKRFADRMASTSAGILVAINEGRLGGDLGDYVQRLCHDALNPKAVTERFVRCLDNHVHKVDNPDSPLASATSDKEVIEIPSDTDDSDHGGGHGEPVDQGAESGTGTVSCSATPAKRPAARGSQNIAPRSRPKRARRSYYPSDRLDGPSDSESEDLRSPTGFRAVKADEIQEKEYAFEYPTVGPGFFVIRCGRGNNMSIFVDDPLCNGFAIEHFKQKGRCHKGRRQTYTEEQLVRNFGYTVIDSDGEDVDGDWVTTSNLKLAKRLDREDARKSKAKGKQKASRPPPLPRLGPARRGTPPLEVYVAHASATAASSARSKTAGPPHSAETPDQAASVGSANLKQQVEAQDPDMLQINQIVDDLIAAEEQAPHSPAEVRSATMIMSPPWF